VAIIVPSTSSILEIAKSRCQTDCYENLIRDASIIQYVLDELVKAGKNGGLNSMELIKAIYLEPQSFSELELTTSSMKLKRHKFEKHYHEILKTLYSEYNKKMISV